MTPGCFIFHSAKIKDLYKINNPANSDGVEEHAVISIKF